MESQVRKTAHEIVVETINYYKEDPSKRARIEGTCVYLDIVTGNKCAVGRCMVEPQSEWFGGIGTIYKNRTEWEKDTTGKGTIDIEDTLKEQYKGHPTELWKDLQWWHDSEANWEGGDITEKGVEQANRLLDKYLI